MNILGHAGLTMGAVYAAGYLADLLLTRRHAVESPDLKGAGGRSGHLQAWPKSLERVGLDFRLVLIGSLLPDIIDKPLGFWLLPEVVNFNARSVGHSLSFNMGLLMAALLLLGAVRYRGFLILALASMGHLLLDEMWRWPLKLLWPWYGWDFPKGSTKFDEWLSFQISGEWLGPTELAGALFLAWFAIHLYRRRAMWQFFKSGTLGSTYEGRSHFQKSGSARR